jgi:hypothetical protein
MKVVLAPLVMAGGALTLTLSIFDAAALPELVCWVSPPPHANAVLVTVVGEFEVTSTVRLIVELEPPAIPGVAVQVIVPLPEQFHRLLVDV